MRWRDRLLRDFVLTSLDFGGEERTLGVPLGVVAYKSHRIGWKTRNFEA